MRLITAGNAGGAGIEDGRARLSNLLLVIAATFGPARLLAVLPVPQANGSGSRLHDSAGAVDQVAHTGGVRALARTIGRVP